MTNKVFIKIRKPFRNKSFQFTFPVLSECQLFPNELLIPGRHN